MYYREPSLADGLAGLFIAALIVEVWLAVKISMLIIRAFLNHPKSKLLWGFLATVVISLVVITCVLLQSQGQPIDDPVQRVVVGVFGVLAVLGFLGLLITSLVFHLQDSDTLVPEKVNLIDSILHQSWWGEEKPLEFEREQVAA